MTDEWPPKWRDEKPPKWDDEDGVALLVWERMMRVEEARDWSWDINPDGDEAKQIAAAAAKKGNFRPLIALLRQERARLSAEARELIARRLEGAPREPVRPKMTEQERRVAASVHDAAEIEPYIEAILNAYYPDRSADKIRDRACALAAQAVNLDDNERWRHYFGASATKPRLKATAEGVIKHLTRSEKDRHRIS